MGLLIDNSIIHASADIDTANYSYTQVYCGANATPTINGVAVTMSAGSLIDIRIGTISATANVYVIGAPINTITGSVIL